MLFVTDAIVSERCDWAAPEYPRWRAYCFIASLIR